MTHLVLVPGVNNTRDTWNGVIAALPATITCHPQDCAALPSVEAIAADLLAQAPARFHLAGFSFGGYVALAMLEQAPERIEGLALICTSSFADTEQQKAARDAAAAAAERGDHMKLVEGPGAIALHPDAARDPQIAALRLRIARAYGEKRFIAHQYASKARDDRTALLAAAPIPRLLVAAEDDRVIPLETMGRMAEAVPQAQWMSVPRAGHLLPIEQPDVLARVLGTWIGSSQQQTQ
ncbi:MULTISPECIES: alpha/beta hydrolase [unclassified Beijerinckia]|uniref:alpha/beta fold hydrolase n=1 Tax=unclassified Beijerinckia TaxID=2638183 RepID=UPI000894CA89|nr:MULTISPECIES: alpha/beta hydrolase [unclassified Beijerinckia]MDH7796519.1 pimeloyl-ACP methyl ester carboxylesterase [Beijerinckia sp. GAS462]SEC48581.1 Pimeloyl-ACP methyl ester carboxylesterase [Beijerinckia sp. 28-YEA-48]